MFKISKKSVIKTLLVISFFIVFISCDDIIQSDISDEKVVLMAPADSLIVTHSNVAFWWDKTKAAEKYNLQIAVPTFDKPEALLIDTNITGNKISIELGNGSFQWRVKAVNSISETQYSMFNLTVKQDTSHVKK